MFFHLKGCLFFQNLCFQQAVVCYRSLTNSQTMLEYLRDPEKSVPRGLAFLIKGEKIG